MKNRPGSIAYHTGGNRHSPELQAQIGIGFKDLIYFFSSLHLKIIADL
jgi:hypothetical protein